MAVGLVRGPGLRISAVTPADDEHVGGHVDSRRRMGRPSLPAPSAAAAL